MRGVQSLIAQVREEQSEANLALAAYVSEERLAGLAERLDELARAAADAGAEAEPPEPAPEGADGRGATVPISVNGGGAE